MSENLKFSIGIRSVSSISLLQCRFPLREFTDCVGILSFCRRRSSCSSICSLSSQLMSGRMRLRVHISPRLRRTRHLRLRRTHASLRCKRQAKKKSIGAHTSKRLICTMEERSKSTQKSKANEYTSLQGSGVQWYSVLLAIRTPNVRSPLGVLRLLAFD